MSAANRKFPKYFLLRMYVKLNFVRMSQFSCVLLIAPTFSFALNTLKPNGYYMYCQISKVRILLLCYIAFIISLDIIRLFIFLM